MADTTRILPSEVSPAPTDAMGVNVGDRLNGLYYYYLENGMFMETASGEEQSTLIYNTSILGTTDAICNVTYTPFLNITSGELFKIPYDTDRFGDVKGSGKPNVFRVRANYTPKEMTLISHKLYDLEKPKSHKDPKHWYYETKLSDYPYRSIIFYSNVFDKYEIIPHLYNRKYLGLSGDITLRACTPMSAQGSFYLYVNGYKDESLPEARNKSILERYFVNSSMDIPNTSSAYSNFMSTQKATNAVQHQQKLHEANMIPIMNAVNAGSIVGAGLGAITGSYQSIKNTQFAVNEQNAMRQDLLTTPNSLKSAGGDLLTRLGVSKQTEVFSADLQITWEYKQRLAEYFNLYGYKQNRVMKLSRQILRSRYYHNYIKTIGCSLTSDGVPKKYIDQLQEIFDNGVTLWHVDRADVKFGEYNYDNSEISIVGE